MEKEDQGENSSHGKMVMFVCCVCVCMYVRVFVCVFANAEVAVFSSLWTPFSWIKNYRLHLI